MSQTVMICHDVSYHAMICYNMSWYFIKFGKSHSMWNCPPIPIKEKHCACVSSVIHKARTTVSPTLFSLDICFVLLYFENWGRTDWKHVQKQWSLPALTVGRPNGSTTPRGWKSQTWKRFGRYDKKVFRLTLCWHRGREKKQ